MPRKLPPDFTDHLLAEVARHPDGVGIDALRAAFGEVVSRRTLQRRLSDLTGARRLIARGEGKARVYRPAGLTLPGQTLDGLPISPDAAELRAYVRQPPTQRKPVGYDRGFLDRYRPNHTYYLPPGVRDSLYRIGAPREPGRPAGTFARQILDRLLIDLSWASSRLEGNTYTRLDTQNLIEFGRVAEGKAAAETQMILNHKAAIELLVEEANRIGFDAFTFLNLHALLSENLLADPNASGRLRARPVDVTGTVYIPLAIPQQIEECFRLILRTADAIADPFEQAFFVMVHIPYLQPFEDVNKRVSRLGANIPLIKRNLNPLSFVDVPERDYIEGTLAVYELTRVELIRDLFVWAYERSAQRYSALRRSVVEPDPFRLAHRAQLIELVGEVVRRRLAAEEPTVRRLASMLVAAADLDRFVAMALNDLEHLYEGNIARYRLGLSEYQAWKTAGMGLSP